MKLNNLMKHICCNAWMAAAVVLAGACSNEEWTDIAPGQQPAEPGLYLSLMQDGGIGSVVRANPEPGADALNENAIDKVDIFIFKSDGTLNPGGHVLATPATPDEVIAVYKGSQWLSNFQQDETYTAYVVANCTTQLDGIQSLNDLKKAVAADDDIAKWEGMKEGADTYSGKRFLMDGKKSFSYSDLQAAGKKYELSVPVYRAAAKIELTIKFSDKWKLNFQATGLKAQLTNYAIKTIVIADGNELDADGRGFATYPETPTDAKERFSSAPIYDLKAGFDGSSLRFYTYVNRWDDEVANETMLLIDLPGNMLDGSGDGLEHNFYKIPIISNAKVQRLQRNTLYRITATVDMKGSADVDVPVELFDVQFKTAEWVSETVNVGDGDTPTYLILNEDVVDVRNADGYYDLKFYSSSPITNVEIVGFNSQQEATAAGVNFIYPGEGTSIPGIFFVDKNNQRKEVSANNPNGDSGGNDKVEVEFDHSVTNGGIRLTSTNPINVTKRYITLKVTSADGLVKYVVVEQYPLEYIQPIAGYYSYRDDFKSGSNVTPPNTVCQWEADFSNGSSRTVPTSNNFFQSKVVYNNVIRTYEYASYRPTVRCWSTNSYSLQNEMMYFVTITSTDGQYKIVHPILENVNLGTDRNPDFQDVTSSVAENNNLVSPAFMLASQLGAVQHDYIGGWANARKHCAHYAETYVNESGATVALTDWRMPTTAELEIIKRYQTTTPDVMDKVLSGDYYYAADGSSFHADGGTSNRNAPSIRCIRDVKPTDEFMKSNN